MPTVQVEGVGVVQFPDDMTPEQITQAIEKEMIAQPRTGAQEFGRQLALTGRAIAEGLIDIAAIPANAVAGLGNMMLEIDRRIAGNQTRANIPEQSSAFSRALTEVGVPAPESEAERLANVIGRRATGAAATMGAGLAISGVPGTAGTVGAAMSSGPVTQAVGSATGPLAAEIARRAGIGQTGQAVADLAGSVAPALLSAGSQMTTRAAFRGGEEGRQTVERNVETFARANTTPSVGQATERRVAQGAEGMLSRVPGGAGVLSRRAEAQADEIAAGIEQRASQLVGRSSAEQAGRTIERQVRGAGGFVDRFRATQDRLYGSIDQFIPDGTPVSVQNTQNALADMTRLIPGAQATSQRLVNPRIADLAADVATDAQNGTIPYQALRELRTMIGREMSNGLVSDVPAAEWRRLYGALSQDLEQAARAAGPQASAAYSRANNYTRAGMQRIQTIESVIDRSGGPEAIFRAATANTKEGATTLRAVMQSLDDDGQRMVTATVLRRLGLAKAGVQGELGDRFSTETFLTNWNLLSNEAKRALFDRHGPRFRADMDAVAGVAANLRSGSQVFRNPSGTQQATAQVATVAGLVTSIMTGQWEATALITGGVAASDLSGRLLTNPRFVRWLAQSTRAPVAAFPAAVNSLGAMAAKSEDMDLARAAALLEQHDDYKNDENDRYSQ